MAPSVRLAAPQLAAAIDAIGERLAAGGRLLYVGAGTSGRLALVDAAECVPTFGVPPTTVVAIVAGGAHAHAVAQESAEDDEAAGAADLAAAGVGPSDAVVGISAGGRTPYVLAALAASPARQGRSRSPWSARAVSDRRRRRPRGGDARRARGDRRLDPHEGGHRPEAGAEHDLDRGDGAARPDLREPDGRRRRRRTRSCGPAPAGPSPPRPACPTRPPPTRSMPPTARRRSPSSPCLRGSTPPRRARGSTRSAARCGRRVWSGAVRLGVEVGAGRRRRCCRATSRSWTGGSPASAWPGPAGASRCPVSSICR